MKTLILSQRHTPDSRRIATAAQTAGYTTVRFRSEELPAVVDADDVKVYCEGFLAEYISQNSSVVLFRPLEDALAKAPDWATKRRIRRMPASALREVTFPCFVKPVDQKFFTAGIYADAAALAAHIAAFPADDVYVSDIVRFVDEYRHFVLNGTVIAASPYELGRTYVGDDADLPPVPSAIIAFAERVVAACAEWLPPACVVDIGFTDAGDTALIEFNPAWASGIYGCDPAACLPAILASCGDRRNLPETLKRFETFACAKKS